MSPGSSTESYPAFARIGLRENPGKNLNQLEFSSPDEHTSQIIQLPLLKQRRIVAVAASYQVDVMFLSRKEFVLLVEYMFLKIIRCTQITGAEDKFQETSVPYCNAVRVINR
ncbi:hypothetical protein ANN_14371 [Periplaneta americana]|uniref:Uncharacterized protein n=1 Tax=Periplaneta americana TaxID=6978 RepID=A0ABQ8SXC1_PERAM|nr:hypothetical protein ANN_14371 [Periplaneta americana]